MHRILTVFAFLAPLTACNDLVLFCGTPMEYPANFVWDSEPMSVDASSTVVYQLTGRIDAPVERIVAELIFEDLTGGPLGVSVVDCDDLTLLQELSGTEDRIGENQPFDAECERGSGCAVEICLSFDNSGATPIQAEVLVGLITMHEIDCEDDPVHAPPGPLRELDAEIVASTR